MFFLMVFIIWQPCPGADPGAITRPTPCTPPARRPSGTIHSCRPGPFSSPGLAPRRHQLTPAAARGEGGTQPAAPPSPHGTPATLPPPPPPPSIPSGAVGSRSHGGRSRQRLGAGSGPQRCVSQWARCPKLPSARGFVTARRPRDPSASPRSRRERGAGAEQGWIHPSASPPAPLHPDSTWGHPGCATHPKPSATARDRHAWGPCFQPHRAPARGREACRGQPRWEPSPIRRDPAVPSAGSPSPEQPVGSPLIQNSSHKHALGLLLLRNSGYFLLHSRGTSRVLPRPLQMETR